MNQNNGVLSFQSALIAMRQLEFSGVRVVVASPGLRNSPLLLAAHQTPGLRVLTAVDERGGGFLALGICRASREPVALLCTSGTAVANYFPAVLEANHSQLPLIVLTADRPVDLVGTGANQCTDQTKLFGSHVRHFAEVAPAVPESLNHGGYAIARAVARAQAPHPGPVHVNLRFREPFLPEKGAFPDSARTAENLPPWKFLPAISGPSAEQLSALRAMVEAAERPLIVLGPCQLESTTALALTKFSENGRIPIVAEAASGISFLGKGDAHLSLMRAESLFEEMIAGKLPAPDLVLRFGEPLTGRPFGRLLQKFSPAQVVFEDWGEAREPHLHTSIIAEGGLAAWAKALAECSLKLTAHAWCGALQDAEAIEEKRIDAQLEKFSSFTEWHFHRAWAKKIGEGANLFLGNSMPIRDFNSVFPRVTRRLQIMANRGLSGIDGLLATAAGVAFGGAGETHCVIGDLSALHDISSLSLLRSLQNEINLTIWVMNNGGGEIFRIVPTVKSEGKLEWFTTPQEYDLASLAKAFQIPFSRIRSESDLNELGENSFATKGVRLLEVLVDPETNLRVRQTFHRP